MTAVDYLGELLGRPQFNLSNPATAVLDGASDYIAGVFIANKTGTIDRIQCYCTAVSSPVSTNARLESVAAGAPSGSLIATNTSGSFTPASATLHTITLTASYNVTVGEPFAVVLNAPTAGASNTQTFNARVSASINGGLNNYFPRSLLDLSAGSWTANSTEPTVVAMYSDGTYVPGAFPAYTLTNHTFNNTSTPDERGNRWTQIGNHKCYGAGIYVRGSVASDDWNVKLYPTTANNASPLGTYAMAAASYVLNTAITGFSFIYWSTPFDLVDGVDYRLTIQPSTANNMIVPSNTFSTAAMRKTVSHFYGTSRTRTADGDDGTWTDDETQMYGLWPLFSQSNPSGGGPLIGPGRLLRAG